MAHRPLALKYRPQVFADLVGQDHVTSVLTRAIATGGRYRVVILDEVHQLSNDAFAALLKTLEEPPPHLVFIFATTDPQKLPDTIRSRCQRFDFARVPLRKVAERLQEIQTREAKD